MKKLMIVAFMLALCLCLSLVCYAQSEAHTVQETAAENEIDVQTYVMEKIVPVAVAALTSALAFLATIGTVARSLKSLKDTKESFSDEAKERAIFFESGIELLDEKARELKELVSDVPRLKRELEALTQECRLNSEILTLGFSSNSDVIKSGKGKKMAMLLEKSKDISSSDEINPSSEFVK